MDRDRLRAGETEKIGTTQKKVVADTKKVTVVTAPMAERVTMTIAPGEKVTATMRMVDTETGVLASHTPIAVATGGRQSETTTSVRTVLRTVTAPPSALPAGIEIEAVAATEVGAGEVMAVVKATQRMSLCHLGIVTTEAGSVTRATTTGTTTIEATTIGAMTTDCDNRGHDNRAYDGREYVDSGRRGGYR